jgi:quinol monooxygenase YgiN
METDAHQITSISFFRYSGLSAKLWAFGMMQFAHSSLANVDGQEFYKLMGSGKGNGFNPYPDWSTYSLIQIWSDEIAANEFFERSRLMKKYREKADEVWTIYMRSIKAHGEWSGQNPFRRSSSIDPSNRRLCVITRATIKTSMLRKFWKYVPHSEKPLTENSGLIYTKGIGEVPLTQMATFSIWEDEDALKAFAYNSPEHRKAIEKTRKLGWYSEELFSRFQPYRSFGRWLGRKQLPELDTEISVE